MIPLFRGFRLAQYIHPKRKAMELGPGKDGEPLKIVVERVGI
ncbi:MAG: hypothetical protein ABSE85_06790 [Candidatus Korobacteraceae bacterium]